MATVGGGGDKNRHKQCIWRCLCPKYVFFSRIWWALLVSKPKYIFFPRLKMRFRLVHAMQSNGPHYKSTNSSCDQQFCSHGPLPPFVFFLEQQSKQTPPEVILSDKLFARSFFFFCLENHSWIVGLALCYVNNHMLYATALHHTLLLYATSFYLTGHPSF
jgi:hypothetical protein